MEDIHASLSSLPPSEQCQYLLSCLSSAYTRQLSSERKAEHWRQHCTKVKQRLKRLSADIASLQNDMDEGAGSQQPQHPQHTHMNGKEEKQYNGHTHHNNTHTQHQQQQQHSLATSQPPSHASDSADELTFNDFNDYSTLLAATEAKLDVERRQKQSQQPQHSTSLSSSTAQHTHATLTTSSPYYHHDHTLTEAGKQLVRTILQLVSPSRTLDQPRLQQLCERLGRVTAGDDEDGDVWWIWQSQASEGEDGEQCMGQVEMEQLYTQEWDLTEDAKRLGLA